MGQSVIMMNVSVSKYTYLSKELMERTLFMLDKVASKAVLQS